MLTQEVFDELKRYHANVLPGLASDIARYFSHHNLEIDDLRLVHGKYRNSNKGRFCPTINDLRPYLPRYASSELDARFITMVEYYGWDYTVEKWANTEILNVKLERMKIDQLSVPYCHFLPWLRQYMELIHVDGNIIAAYRYASEKAQPEFIRQRYKTKIDKYKNLLDEEINAVLVNYYPCRQPDFHDYSKYQGMRFDLESWNLLNVNNTIKPQKSKHQMINELNDPVLSEDEFIPF